MSGIKPSFITGATAKIRAGGKTLAYAQDVSYTVTVSTIPVETMGRYEAVNHEPVAYFVEGSLSVVRYTKNAANRTADDDVIITKPDGTTQTLTNLSSNKQIQSAAAGGNAVANWAGNMFNPGSMLSSKTIDIEIFSKNDSSAATDKSELVGKLRDCRLTSKGGVIDKRGILVERYSFNAILMDDDGQVTGTSGDNDLS